MNAFPRSGASAARVERDSLKFNHHWPLSTASEKTTPWASQDISGYPGIDFVDWDNPG